VSRKDAGSRPLRRCTEIEQFPKKTRNICSRLKSFVHIDLSLFPELGTTPAKKEAENADPRGRDPAQIRNLDGTRVSSNQKPSERRPRLPIEN
jgi:hypothetical protein